MLIFLKDLKRQVLECFAKKKVFLILIISTFLLGVIIAVISLFGLRDILSFRNLLDNPLCLYIKKDINLFSFFIRRFFLLLLCGCVCFLLILNKYTKYFCLLIFLYLSYFFVFNMGIIIISFGFFGLLFAIFVMLLFWLLYLFLLLCFVMLCLNSNCKYSKDYKTYLIFGLFIMVLFFLLALLEMILTALLSSAFIINYL